jgi:hypothetical protein|tara:strand:- start:880 stop:1020 length:141 start_codon:yes stop_codon:yes gene_type:complete
MEAILKRLEHVGGDGVENEIWQDTKTKKLYNVPIEIIRRFNHLEEI